MFLIVFRVAINAMSAENVNTATAAGGANVLYFPRDTWLLRLAKDHKKHCTLNL